MLAKGKWVVNDDFPVAQAAAAVAEWKTLREFFTGDLHVLVPLSVSPADWCRCHLHRADLGAGFAMFFRRQESPFPTLQAGLKDLDPSATYEVSLSETYQEGPKRKMSGKELAAMSVTIDGKPGSLLLRYHRI